MSFDYATVPTGGNVSGVDTVASGLGEMCLYMGCGFPADADTTGFIMEFTSRPEDIGRHICVDSINDRRTWPWEWATRSGSLVIHPGWGGGRCFVIGSCEGPPDGDGDNIRNECDNCLTVANADQSDLDRDSVGDACDVCARDSLNDADGDGFCADVDNCATIANSSQIDTDRDDIGDECDGDKDGDGISNEFDNCPLIANADQSNLDGDWAGDSCDGCPIDPANDRDGDGYCANVDNCPWGHNPDQEDSNFDGIGDSCTIAEPTPAGDNINIHLGSEADGEYYDVSVTFDNVTSGGNTQMTLSPAGSGPSGYQVVPVDLPVYYNITTNAAYAGVIEVCVEYPDCGTYPEYEQGLTLLHHTVTGWENITSAGYPDVNNNVICGVTTSLSPFVVAFRTGCCVGRVGDANGDGDYPDEVTLGDIMLMVDAKFISGDCSKLTCLTEADVTQDGGTNPNCEDNVTLGDIMTLVDFLFITGPETAVLPDCL